MVPGDFVKSITAEISKADPDGEASLTGIHHWMQQKGIPKSTHAYPIERIANCLIYVAGIGVPGLVILDDIVEENSEKNPKTLNVLKQLILFMKNKICIASNRVIAAEPKKKKNVRKRPISDHADDDYMPDENAIYEDVAVIQIIKQQQQIEPKVKKVRVTGDIKVLADLTWLAFTYLEGREVTLLSKVCHAWNEDCMRECLWGQVILEDKRMISSACSKVNWWNNREQSKLVRLQHLHTNACSALTDPSYKHLGINFAYCLRSLTLTDLENNASPANKGYSTRIDLRVLNKLERLRFEPSSRHDILTPESLRTLSLVIKNIEQLSRFLHTIDRSISSSSSSCSSSSVQKNDISNITLLDLCVDPSAANINQQKRDQLMKPHRGVFASVDILCHSLLLSSSSSSSSLPDSTAGFNPLTFREFIYMVPKATTMFIQDGYIKANFFANTFASVEHLFLINCSRYRISRHDNLPLDTVAKNLKTLCIQSTTASGLLNTMADFVNKKNFPVMQNLFINAGIPIQKATTTTITTTIKKIDDADGFIPLKVAEIAYEVENVLIYSALAKKETTARRDGCSFKLDSSYTEEATRQRIQPHEFTHLLKTVYPGDNTGVKMLDFIDDELRFVKSSFTNKMRF